jgi:ATP-binding cassette subfamily B protein
MLAFAWAADRRLACWTFALLTLQAAAASLLSLWLRVLTDGVTGHDQRLVLLAGLAIALSVTVTAGVEYAGNRARMTLGDRTQYLLQRRLLEMVAGSPTLTLHETPEYLRQLELLQLESWEFSQVVPAVIEAATSAVRILITAALLVSVSPLLLVLPLFALPMLALSRRTADLYNLGNDLAAEQARRAEMLYQLAASRSAAAELRLFRLRGELLSRFAAEHEDIRGIHVRLGLRGLAFRLAGRSVFLAGYLGAIALVLQLAARGEVSVGDVAMTAVLAGQVLMLVTGSAEHAHWLQRTLTSAARYVFLEEVTGPAVRPAAASGRAAPVSLARGIVLDRVCYTYPGLEPAALREVTAVLPAGATVAIVGDNGAGKTTLVSLLAGLRRPTSGRILVDGIDLAGIDPEAWRLRISAAFQDHARFEFTMQRAVGLGDLPHLDDAVAVAAALDRAGAADLAGRAAGGLARQLGPAWPGGVDLSGGEWQKLAIGRAMMRPAPLLLLLDEPTAAIDAETEHVLFARWTQAARRARRAAGAITVLVSHRFATVQMADLILVLRDGTICESGSHADLMAAGGLYAELFELQARAYR